MDEPIGRSCPVDECLGRGAEQRRQSFGCRVGEERPPAPRHDQDASDPDEHQRASEPTTQIVEDQRNVVEQRRLDFAHPIGPVLLDRERLGGNEQCQRDEQSEESCSQRQYSPRALDEVLASVPVQHVHPHSVLRELAVRQPRSLSS